MQKGTKNKVQKQLQKWLPNCCKKGTKSKVKNSCKNMAATENRMKCEPDADSAKTGFMACTPSKTNIG